MHDRSDSYSGRDTTGEVWQLLESVIGVLDSDGLAAAHAEMCQQAHDLEEDSNWRGFALGLKGLVLQRLGNSNEARDCLERAVDLTATYADNFEDIANVYCQACYTLGSILFDDMDQTQPAILTFLRCLPYMHDVYSDLYIGNIFGFLDVLFSRQGREQESAVFAESALYYHGLESPTLESLMYSYVNLGDKERARAVLRVLLDKVTDPDSIARIEDFADRRL